MTDEGHHRARDPGVRLSQVPGPTWVHCPECDGPAQLTGDGAACTRCDYRTIPTERADLYRWGQIGLNDPRCVHCRNPLPVEPLPTGRVIDNGKQVVRVKCPHCGRSEDYPARIAFPPTGASRHWPDRLKLYLTAQVGGETLWVDNLAHLALLEDYLGAKVRERGPVAGLTMMARLPPWMKAATMRPKILRALRQLRERAEKAGITQ